jgi:hypothetical protein
MDNCQVLFIVDVKYAENKHKFGESKLHYGYNVNWDFSLN